MKKYLKLLIVTLLIISCSEEKVNSLIMKSKETCHISLGIKSVKKIELNFPFETYNLEKINWRCTSSEPFCEYLGNNDVEIKVCHKFSKERLVEKRSLKEMESQIEETQIIQMKEARKKRSYSTIKLQKLPTKVSKLNDTSFWNYGFIHETKSETFLHLNYSKITPNEYLSLEFQSTGKRIDIQNMIEEFQYIKQNLKEEPMHNNR